MAILLNPTNVNIEINDDIGLMCISEEFSNHAPRETYLIQSQYEAARAFFQAERDDALGRWRDTENPNVVVYPCLNQDDGYGRVVWVLDEAEMVSGTVLDDRHSHSSASRYFAAHPQPEPKPWLEAEHEEIWVITANGDTGPALATTSHRRGTDLAFQTANGTLLDATEITAGRRIWPERKETKDDE